MMALLAYSFGFVWNLALQNSSLRAKTQSKKYRFSFVRMMMEIDHFFSRHFNQKNFLLLLLIRSLYPVFFSGLFMLIFRTSIELHFVLIGALSFEVIYFCYHKRSFLDVI